MRDDDAQVGAKITCSFMKRIHFKGDVIMYIKEVEKRGQFTLTTIYSVKDYFKEKGIKKTVKAVVNEVRGK